ncbi:hypothetical protein [Streptomyces sp. 135]|uniref:hypothetical protein n=1 Tax=unclassified Streptomyces TaxID=2593676 RepID=UPI001CBBA122|nr:hypothetical protein [Streptomyces sp. 135]
MNGERKHRTTTASGHVCGSCKQPVDAVVVRHKSLGVFVPAWVAGPCQNPRCEEYVPESAHIVWTRSGWERKTGRVRR